MRSQVQLLGKVSLFIKRRNTKKNDPLLSAAFFLGMTVGTATAIVKL